jgi:hypothetical protein
MVLGSTQPQNKMSTAKFPGRGLLVSLTTSQHSVS